MPILSVLRSRAIVLWLKTTNVYSAGAVENCTGCMGGGGEDDEDRPTFLGRYVRIYAETIWLKPIQRPTRFKRFIPLARHDVAYVSLHILYNKHIIY